MALTRQTRAEDVSAMVHSSVSCQFAGKLGLQHNGTAHLPGNAGKCKHEGMSRTTEAPTQCLDTAGEGTAIVAAPALERIVIRQKIRSLREYGLNRAERSPARGRLPAQ